MLHSCFNLDYKIDEDINKILKNFDIYKRIDFNTDINIKLSGKYTINDKSKELVFICGDCKSLFDYEGYFLNNNNMFYHYDKIKFVPNVFCNDNNIYYSSYFSELKLSDNDMIYVDFQKFVFNEVTQDFRIMITNLDTFNFLYRYINNCKYSKILFSKWLRLVLRKDIISLDAINKENKIQEYYLEKKEKSDKKCFLEMEDNPYRVSLIDIKLPRIFINNKDYIFKKDYFDNDVRHILISYSNVNEKLDFEIEKKDILVCKKTGFIYLNPIYIKKNSKILVFSKGDIALEYYSSQSQKWIKFNKLFMNSENEIINIRIKISNLNTIRGIYLVT